MFCFISFQIIVCKLPSNHLLLQVGYSVLHRSGGANVAPDTPLSITHQCLRPLESLMKCVEMGWMTIVVGPTASGKTSLVRLLSLLTGHRLRIMAMNSAMDTTELLGGFEQVTLRTQVFVYNLKIADHVNLRSFPFFLIAGGYHAPVAASSGECRLHSCHGNKAWIDVT